MSTSYPQPQARARLVLTLLLALIPMIVLRRELGMRLMHPGRLLVVAGLVVGGPHAINLFYQQALNTPVLAVFAGIVFFLGWRHRQWHARELASGVSQVHTLETGYSVLVAALPALPPRLALCVDPAACMLAGYLATYVCPPFGVFMGLCGGALAVVSFQDHAQSREEFLDAHDGLREAERHGAMAEHHAGRTRRNSARPQTAGTPAGAGDDIEWHLARQRD
jgi:hypothetical protein